MNNVQKFWCVLAALGIVVGIPALDIGLQSIFLPAREELGTKVYNNTTSYINGKNETVARLKLDYETEADTVKKNAIRAYVLAEVAEMDTKKLTEDNQEFVSKLKEQN